MTKCHVPSYVLFLVGSDLLHDEALDDVADLDVVELLDLHAAFIALGDLADVVLEAAQGGKLALVDDDVG